MKQKLTFLAVLFILPFSAFAHGQEVLLPFFIQWASILIFIILLTSSKLKVRQKLILGASYFITMGLIVCFTWNVPYSQNRTFLDLALSLGPAAVAALTYFILKFHNRNRILKKAKQT
jgi:hypothetical protein